MVPIEDIKPTHSLQRYGMDSLVAVELKHWLYKTFWVEFSVTDIMETPSISALEKKRMEWIWERGRSRQ
ncbi:hypothetical protein EV426DRAFT_704960 [Tirmania nivea]|nr:hypothetical protein EV426DRAFT_704960 [Tirmania nivea]